MPQFKKCPDCAETVLAEARKCRYCGSRFDTGDEPQEQGRLGDLRSLWTKPTHPSTVPATVASWGTELQPGEEVVCFRLACVDSSVGYLLVTDRRFCFFDEHERKYRLTLEQPVTSLLAVQRVGRFRRGRLLLRGLGYDLTVRGLGSKALDELDAALSLGAH